MCIRRLRRTRLLVLLLTTLVLPAFGVSGCGDDKIIGSRGGAVDYYRETIVLPGGSEIGVRYWRIVGKGILTEQITRSDLPWGGKVVDIRTVVGAAPGPSPGVFAPSTTAAPETTIVALITGGRIPGGPFASTRVGLVLPGEPMVTGLNMTAARTEHAMATLPDGRILITGGYGPGSPPPVLASAELFTLAARSFVPTGAMVQGRADHAVTALADGRALITGGLVLDGAGPATIDVATTEIWDPASGTFAAGPPLADRRFNHSAIRLHDGRVLVVGGNARTSAEVYSPATNAFTTVGPVSAVHGNGHVALLLRNGKVLVLGGDLGNINPTAVAELFDPATNSFTSAGTMSTPRMLHFAVLLDDGTVMIGGGRGPGGDPLNSSELYDPVANTFTPLPNLPSTTYEGPAAFVQGPGPG